MARSFESMCPKLEQQEDPQREEPVLAFDFPGAITLAIAISSLLVVIDLKGSLSWAHPLVQSIVAVGILSTLAFLVFETFPGNRELLMPLKLLKTEIGAFCAGQLLLVASGYGVCEPIPCPCTSLTNYFSVRFSNSTLLCKYSRGFRCRRWGANSSFQYWKCNRRATCRTNNQKASWVPRPLCDLND